MQLSVVDKVLVFFQIQQCLFKIGIWHHRVEVLHMWHGIIRKCVPEESDNPAPHDPWIDSQRNLFGNPVKRSGKSFSHVAFWVMIMSSHIMKTPYPHPINAA
jgi:hypothetical protein